MIDANLIRWINLSINKYFDDGKGAYKLFIEGQEMDFASNLQSWAELHVSTGPDIDEVSSGCFEIDLTLTIMCSAIYNNDDQLLNKITGFFQNLMTGCITIYKYGTGVGDDNAAITTLRPIKVARVFPWGPYQVDGKAQGPIRAKMQSVEQSYHVSF